MEKNVPFGMESKTVKLKSTDGIIREVDAFLLNKSKLLSGLLMDYPDDNSVIPLCKVDAKNLHKSLIKNGDILLSFSPRKNFKLNNKKGVILTNNLLISIYSNNNVVRQEQIQNKNSFNYSVEKQMQDFSKTIGLKDFTYEIENLVVM